MLTTDKKREIYHMRQVFRWETHLCTLAHSSSLLVLVPRGAIRELRCPSGWLEVRGARRDIEKHSCVPSLIAPHSSSSPPRGAIRELRCPSGWLEVRGARRDIEKHTCVPSLIAPHSSSSPPRGAIRELRCPSGWLEVRGARRDIEKHPKCLFSKRGVVCVWELRFLWRSHNSSASGRVLDMFMLNIYITVLRQTNNQIQTCSRTWRIITAAVFWSSTHENWLGFDCGCTHFSFLLKLVHLFWF